MIVPIVYTMTQGGSEMQTTMDCDLGEVDLADARDALQTFWQDGLAKSMSSFCDLLSIKIGPDLFTAVGEGGINQPPENTSAAAIVNKLNSGAKGRFFMPGLPQDAVEFAGTLLPSWKATYTTELNAELAVLQGEGLTPMVLGVLGSSRPITSFSVSPVVGLQGRRRFGR